MPTSVVHADDRVVVGDGQQAAVGAEGEVGAEGRGAVQREPLPCRRLCNLP
jgi:hypothetical protein